MNNQAGAPVQRPQELPFLTRSICKLLLSSLVSASPGNSMAVLNQPAVSRTATKRRMATPWSKAEDQTQGESAGTAAAAAERSRDAADPTLSRQKWPEMLLQTDKCEESSPVARVLIR